MIVRIRAGQLRGLQVRVLAGPPSTPGSVVLFRQDQGMQSPLLCSMKGDALLANSGDHTPPSRSGRFQGPIQATAPS